MQPNRERRGAAAHDPRGIAIAQPVPADQQHRFAVSVAQARKSLHEPGILQLRAGSQLGLGRYALTERGSSQPRAEMVCAHPPRDA